MGTDKRQRQKEGRQARIAAAEAEQRHSQRRRKYVSFLVMAVAVLALFAGINYLTGRNKSTKTTTSGSTTTSAATPTTAALASAKGKDCVAMKGTPPSGAPSVPVPVGAPPTSLVVKDLKEGTGATVAAANTTTINYIGVSCSTGEIFDSSWKDGAPITTTLDASASLIDGWKQGIPGMKVGGQRLLGIPPSLGYGSQQSGTIAPDETLWFVVEVEKTVPPSATTTAAAGSGTTTAGG
jgi:peptidylprolyl isomerase